MLSVYITNQFLSKHLFSKAAIALITLVLLTSACGKRLPPLPPLEKVSQRVTIAGFQRGRGVILSWQMPARNAAAGNTQNIDRVDIYRLAEPSDSPLSLTEDEFYSRSVLIKTLPVTAADFALKRLSYTDYLEFENQPARLRYAIRFVNSEGQKATFSNFFVVSPTPKIAGSPARLAAALTQESITLSWSPPETNIDGSKPANILGYNIYRSAAENEAARLLNEAPVTGSNFEDKFFNFDQNYSYFVRAVSGGANGEPLESAESNIVDLTPVDTFAPSAPGSITVAATPNTISIFFAVNPEKDVVGYLIHRSTDPNLAIDRWSLLTSEPLKTNTFEDDGVESGKTYYYYLKAVDSKNNRSAASEVVSETVP